MGKVRLSCVPARVAETIDRTNYEQMLFTQYVDDVMHNEVKQVIKNELLLQKASFTVVR